jgi:FkbM family methyltransferase
LADYADPGRDQMFIDPYVKDGIIELFKYSKINTDISEGISKTQEFLSRKLMKNTNTIINSDYGPIIISSNDKGVGSDIQITGYFEKDQILLICKIIEIMLSKKDRINFYDVGANIGTHTLSIAKTFGNKVKIRSFEAQRQIFYMLCGTVAINNLRNVSCHNLAIGGHNGSLDINLPDYDQVQNFGGFELLPIEKTDNSTMVKNSVEPVNIVTLDSFNEEIDFIKMDIEGMEESALIASSEMLARYKPVCFVEIFKSNETNIFKIFEELGYIGYRTHQDLFALPPGLDVTFSDLPRCF